MNDYNVITGLSRHVDVPSIPIVLIVSWRCWCSCRHLKTLASSVTYYTFLFPGESDLRGVATGIFEALYCYTTTLQTA